MAEKAQSRHPKCGHPHRANDVAQGAGIATHGYLPGGAAERAKRLDASGLEAHKDFLFCPRTARWTYWRRGFSPLARAYALHTSTPDARGACNKQATSRSNQVAVSFGHVLKSREVIA